MPMTRIDRAIAYGEALIDPPTPYGFWRGVWPPPRNPQNPEWMYVETHNPPNPKNQVPNTNCAGLINLMAAAGGSDFRGGTLLFGQRIKNKRVYKPGMRLRRGEVLISAFGGGDEGHIVMVIEDGTDPLTIGSDHSDGGMKPGVNRRYRAQDAHRMFDFEWVGEVPGLELPSAGDGSEEPRPEEPELPERERPEQEVPLFTAEHLSAISGNPDLATLEKYRDALVPEMRKGRIDTYMRATAFLAEIVQETDRLKAREEYASGRAYEGRRDLGNVQPGDGPRFKGRGFIMITGRGNYTAASRDLGVDLVSNPGLASRPDVAARVAVWFWNRNGCSPYADRGEFKAVSAIINTGSPRGEPKGMADRLFFYDRARHVLSRDMRGVPASKNGYNYDGLPLINLAAVGQADETMAFVLAAEIRKAGIGVTVTNGRENVFALAKKMRNEPLGYRQLWIMGDPALDACGEYAELANWPASPKTDYYNLAGRDLTGTCRRAAELADEKAREGVGRRFLEEMEDMAKPASTKPQISAGAQAEEQEDGRKPEEVEYRKRREEEQAEKTEKNQHYVEQDYVEQDYVEQGVRGRRKQERRAGVEKGETDGSEPMQTDGAEPVETFKSEDLGDSDLEEIGREVLRLIRSYTGQGKAPRMESGPRKKKEGD